MKKMIPLFMDYCMSRQLGHSSVKVTEKAYLDVTDEDIRKRYLKFSRKGSSPLRLFFIRWIILQSA